MNNFFTNELDELRKRVAEAEREADVVTDTVSAVIASLMNKGLLTKEDFANAVRELHAYRLEKTFNKDS